MFGFARKPYKEDQQECEDKVNGAMHHRFRCAEGSRIEVISGHEDGKDHCNFFQNSNKPFHFRPTFLNKKGGIFPAPVLNRGGRGETNVRKALFDHTCFFVIPQRTGVEWNTDVECKVFRRYPLHILYDICQPVYIFSQDFRDLINEWLGKFRADDKVSEVSDARDIVILAWVGSCWNNPLEVTGVHLLEFFDLIIRYGNEPDLPARR